MGGTFLVMLKRNFIQRGNSIRFLIGGKLHLIFKILEKGKYPNNKIAFLF